MKKVLIIFCAMMLIAATGAFALEGNGLALGGQTALNFAGTGAHPVGGLLLHLPGFPLMMGIGFSSLPALGMTADYWFARGSGSGILGWYVGIGGYITIFTETNSASFGARLPIGLQFWLLNRRNLEFFLEAAPAVGIRFVPTGFDWHLQAALGLRYWF